MIEIIFSALGAVFGVIVVSLIIISKDDRRVENET